MGFWTQTNQLYAFNYLLGDGLSPYGAAGLVSRWANVESTANGPTAINRRSGAFGIAQWLGSRLPPIRGNTNFDSQLAYAVRELNGSESRAGNILRSAGSPDEGARGASVYERAEGYNPSTGRDNFTARTAQGIPAILALAGNRVGSVSSWGDGVTPAAGSIVAVVVVGALTLFLLDWWLD
ncbi:MAG: hypothetical protein H7Z16_19515 [Pyrinomonadaceae bacterium]|nr:hypothetical protein [Pyrinomonadaceae bacterium]